ncbi:hypothetical protein SARC_06718 [Sphaeroforma arctica JP610]|uniref:Uncharacterized protein n=1 Tax=Sphaeroforma arctica JP610 TaxID=667725 RepID=A0A0L0FVQ2_9EUKA|nr:hypothetical protein SARC_06718 [Sphaeroforma arctica JP610]KNC80930.1 hypothetical protein SARC_06718 [Sphaeroforma arctica JP610]|eukprot:XP_014154832.1 hypothetical protein SARC_06718 [Sphaeroforma arctica JP610]
MPQRTRSELIAAQDAIITNVLAGTSATHPDEVRATVPPVDVQCPTPDPADHLSDVQLPLQTSAPISGPILKDEQAVILNPETLPAGPCWTRAGRNLRSLDVR